MSNSSQNMNSVIIGVHPHTVLIRREGSAPMLMMEFAIEHPLIVLGEMSNHDNNYFAVRITTGQKDATSLMNYINNNS